MPLQSPVLDDRTFEQLVDEARARIPRFTPEWTNLNPADPGMTLVQLHAWLTETILYRLNKLPDLNYIKFLDLLNVRPRPARAANAQLTFKLKKLNKLTDPLVVLIPKNVQVGVDDPDLEEELIFETDRTLTALNAALTTVIAQVTDVSSGVLVTEYDDKTVETQFPSPLYPFGSGPTEGSWCLLGFLLRPHHEEGSDLDRFPEGELDLTVLVPQVFEVNAGGETISGPLGERSRFPWQVTEEGSSVVWEAYTGDVHSTGFTDGDAWQPLSALDETAGLARSGHVYLDVPGGLPTVPFDQLSREVWRTLGLSKPPTDADELVEDLEEFLLPDDLEEETWTALGIDDPNLDDLTKLSQQIQTHTQPSHFNAVENATWIDAGYSETPRSLTWFRVRLEGKAQEPPQVGQILLNTVSATAAVTRVEEIVGTSDGRPNQTHTLRSTPLLVDQESGQPDLTLEIVEQGEGEVWQVVSDFYGVGLADPVFQVDSETGTLTFGDGQHGRIPVAGAEIIARSYRYGGGQAGNAGPGTITALKSVLPNVDSVTNVRAAAGGADAEPIEEVMLRAPHDLRTRDRAVTGDDFAELARQTPGVRIQRAFALPQTSLSDWNAVPPKVGKTAGAITVVVLPENDEDTPQPSEDQIRLVGEQLNGRRLITTELYVTGPFYARIDKLKVEVTASRQVDLVALRESIKERLLDYFHPLRGGEDGRGWPFGQDIYYSSVYRLILGVEGVLRVLCLEIALVKGSRKCEDVIYVPDGALVYLPGMAIDVEVKYDPYG